MSERQPICLVTGCAGFVGSHLTQRLLKRGFSVLGVDNFFSGRRRNMDAFADSPDFYFYESSITYAGILPELKDRWPNLEHIFHLAAVVSVPYSMAHPEETLVVNRDATLALHSQAMQCGVTSFTFAGSAAEYGDDPRLPLKEAFAGPDAKPQSPYGRAKYEASLAIGDSGFGTSLRFFNIYGPHQDPSSPYSGVISRFIDLALRNEPLYIFGDGGQTRDFIHVSDAVDAYLLAAGIESGPVLQGIFNVATGRATTIYDLAKMIGRLTASECEPAFLSPRKGDIRHSLADITRISRCGFLAKKSLEEGLTETVDWYAAGMANCPSLFLR